MRLIRWIAVAAAFAAASCAAPPDGPRSPGAERSGFDGGLAVRPAGLLFAGMDADGDYAIDRAELDAGLARAFAAADADKSGAVTALEYQAWAAIALGSRDALPGRLALDADADNRITAGEFRRGFLEIAEGYGLASGPVPFAALVRAVTPVRLQGGGARDVVIQRRR